MRWHAKERDGEAVAVVQVRVPEQGDHLRQVGQAPQKARCRVLQPFNRKQTDRRCCTGLIAYYDSTFNGSSLPTSAKMPSHMLVYEALSTAS